MADDITPGELGRRMEALAAEVRGFGKSLAELVRRDVYEAHRAADAAEHTRLRTDIERLEREADEREAAHTAASGKVKLMIAAAVLACVGSTVAGIVVGVVLR